MTPDIALLRDLVVRVAREELLPWLGEIRGERKRDGSIVTQVDRHMQGRLQAELAQRWPGFGFLGEEMAAGEQGRLLAGLRAGTDLWCLDPLDGTSNFVAGVPYFAVSLALLSAQGARLAVVYDPNRGECFTAQHGGGAALNGAPLRTPAPVALAAAVAGVDFKRLPPRLACRLGERPPFHSQRNFGASSLDWCWVAAGRLQVYVHGAQQLWDYAAGNLILAEAGGCAYTLAREQVFVAALTPRFVVAAVAPALLAEWQAWLEQAGR